MKECIITGRMDCPNSTVSGKICHPCKIPGAPIYQEYLEMRMSKVTAIGKEMGLDKDGIFWMKQDNEVISIIIRLYDDIKEIS